MIYKQLLKQGCLLSFVFLFNSFAQAQNNSHRLGLMEFYVPDAAAFEAFKRDKNLLKKWRFADSHAALTSLAQQAEGYVSEELSRHNRFELLERSALDKILGEKELQKSEDFIDGYIVEQGRAVGAQYLLFGDFNLEDVSLTISIFDVVSEKTLGKKIIPLKFTIDNDFVSSKKRIQKQTEQLINNVFREKMKIVRITKEKGKSAKQVLLAAGDKHGLKKGKVLLVKYLQVELIDGVELEREETVGELKVEDVENENFSICSVAKGSKQIRQLIGEGKKLYCYAK